MQHVLERVVRKGGIPFCCGGATVCFALYSAKLSHAADLWLAAVDTNQDNNNNNNNNKGKDLIAYQSIQIYARELQQHSGTTLSLSLISASITREAYRDWQQYGSLSSWNELAVRLLQQQRPLPFFFRTPVLVTAFLAVAVSHRL